jgi:allophanate hydrolase
MPDPGGDGAPAGRSSDAGDRVGAAFDRVESLDDPAVFLAIADRATALDRLDPELPLAGLTFAVKDNIDVAGLPTTAACPSFATMAAGSAAVVERLEAAGGTCVGKTNLDQFATGLVGTRSPFGMPRNPIDAALVPGGSSSGSAVAVARGTVDVALGTDTAGSGRVPAAQCRIVGIKPTKGRLSTRGVVPAVRSIDCVSVFARSVSEAWRVVRATEGFDPADPLSRRSPGPPPVPPRWRIGIPAEVDLDGPLDREAWESTVARLGLLGDVVPVDVSAMVTAGELLYGGPWVAERSAAVGAFLDTDPPDADPVVASIIGAGRTPSAIDAYRGAYELAALARRAEAVWDVVDVLCVPTTPGPATVAEVALDPVGRNNRLGRYTNWVNLLDQCAVAVPGADRSDGWPTGLTVLAPAWCDELVVRLAAQFCGEDPPDDTSAGHLDLVVVGAHLEGQPLNGQLTDLGARLVARTRTAADYRLLALADTIPPKPGLVRVPGGGGPIEVEVWRLPIAAVGAFLRQVPAPLALGTVELEDCSQVKGFVCEPRALDGARDITSFGGWRAFLAS